MIPFSQLILQGYYRAIGWNEDNSYSQLTRASTDFAIPESLILQLANAPTPIFFTSYSLDALPQLNGAISYITTSEALDNIGPSRTTPFRNVVERFRIWPAPHRPLPKDEVWQGGKRVEGRDYMLYSRLHLPSLHLSGLYTTRLTPTLQMHLAFLSQPSPPAPRPTSPTNPTHSRQPSVSESGTLPPPNPGNVLFSLQHDTGRFAGEYTYSASDGMFGIRGLYNLGWVSGSDHKRGAEGRVKGKGKARRIDEDEAMEGGLLGRFSAGGEVYFSAKQKSFGRLRFTTIPPTLPLPPGAPPPSPPTVLTLLYNPLIGFISSAYSAQISPTIALSSRFGVNVYSYESDLSVGGEWWIGRRRGKRGEPSAPLTLPSPRPNGKVPEEFWLRDREGPQEDVKMENELDSPFPIVSEHPEPPIHPKAAASDPGETDRDGVLKARISGNWSMALLYEARIRNCLVSLGITSDLLSTQRPIRSVGMEVQYFS